MTRNKFIKFWIIKIDKNRIKRKASPKVQILDVFISKFCQILKEQVFPVLFNLLQSMQKYGKWSCLFYETKMAMTKFCFFFFFFKVKNTVM